MNDICKFGVLADTPTEPIFLDLAPEFCDGVAERELEYSMVFSVSDANHTFSGANRVCRDSVLFPGLRLGAF